MITSSARRVTAVLALIGGVLALVGNALAPRFSGDDPVVYREVAHSDRLAAAGVVILVAIIIVTAAFVGISRLGPPGEQSLLREYGRLATVIGGALALTQIAVELYGYRQEARAFASANSYNVVSAFWGTNALDHASSALMAAWSMVLLGIAPVLLGLAQLRARTSGRFGWAAVLGGAICFVVGVAELLKSDQSTFDIPFAIGSVIVTIWLLATGVFLWRHSQSGGPATT